MTDAEFLDQVADALMGVPDVHGVALGGSRAEGTHTVDSDFDVAVYYRGTFDPGPLRELGWPGEVFDPGAWGAIFDGGAWLTVDGRHVDVHYRNLDVLEQERRAAEHGQFRWEPLAFHLAGIPSYLLLAELATAQPWRGTAPRPPSYPDALRASAPPHWRRQATLTMQYARSAYAPRGRLTEVAGLLATAAMQTAHAVLASRGEWITNEKRLLGRAGLRGTAGRDIDAIVAAAEPDTLVAALDEAEELFASVR